MIYPECCLSLYIDMCLLYRGGEKGPDDVLRTCMCDPPAEMFAGIGPEARRALQLLRTTPATIRHPYFNSLAHFNFSVSGDCI